MIPHQNPRQKNRRNQQQPAVPEDMQAAAQNLLGKETQVLVFGDLAKTGKQQFLAANVVPKTPKNDIPGTIVTRAVLAEETDGKWSELLRCDEYLKNAKGYLALDAVNGCRRLEGAVRSRPRQRNPVVLHAGQDAAPINMCCRSASPGIPRQNDTSRWT